MPTDRQSSDHLPMPEQPRLQRRYRIAAVSNQQIGLTLKVLRSLFASAALLVTGCAASLAQKAPENLSLPHQTSWLGNSFGGKDNKWVQDAIDEIEVAPDGTVYTASEWDESGRCTGVYKNGDVLSTQLKQFDGAGGHKAWGWGTANQAVAIDASRIYLVNTSGELLRFNRSNLKYIDTTPVVEVTKVGDKEVGKAVGLTCAGKLLFIVRDTGEITVRAVSDLKLQCTFTVPQARDVAVAADGTLWVLAGTQIRHFSAQGQAMPQIITDAGKPTSLSFDKLGRLLVCDNGPRRQVLIYTLNKKPRLAGTFGVPGGITAGPRPGEVAPHKLHSLAGAATDAQGNLYVALSSGGDGSVLRQFRPNAKGGWDTPGWELNGLNFVDSVVTDPDTDGVSVYSHSRRFVMDYAQPSGQQWKVRGYTIDPTLEKTDVRFKDSAWHPAFTRRLKGKLLLYMTPMMGGNVEIYSPSAGTELLDPIYSYKRQLDGWGFSVDERGDMWECSGKAIARIPFEGFDAKGKPLFSARQNFEAPAPWSSLQRVYYNSTTDTLFLSGYTPVNKEETWGIIGKEMALYDGWLKGSRTLVWTKAVPHDFKPSGPFFVMKSMSIAGDYLFMVGVQSRAQVRVFDMKDGRFVGMLEPGTEVDGTEATGWIDMPNAIHAVRRKDGEYLVFVEEDARNKILLYRWRPNQSKP